MSGLSELINGRFLLSQLVNFLILFVALYFLFWKRALKAFDDRKAKISQGLADAEAAQQKLADAQQEHDRILAEARREGEGLLAQARQEASEAADTIRARADEEAKAIKAAATEAAEEERQEMLSALRGQVAALSIAAANKVVGEALDEERQHRLIAEFFSGVSSGRVQVLHDDYLPDFAAGATPEVSVVSALPLTSDEQATVARELASQLGQDANVSYNVAPEILGGLRIEVGDRVIDGSVVGKLNALKESLQA